MPGTRRLKQTQAWNKQPALPLQYTSSISTTVPSIQLNRAKPASLTSVHQHTLHFDSPFTFPPLLLYNRLYCVQSSCESAEETVLLTLCTLTQSSLNKGEKFHYSCKVSTAVLWRTIGQLPHQSAVCLRLGASLSKCGFCFHWKRGQATQKQPVLETWWLNIRFWLPCV